jgi:uncharacterized membrane protein
MSAPCAADGSLLSETAQDYDLHGVSDRRGILRGEVMKKLFTISVLLNAALLSVISWNEMIVYAEGGEPNCLFQNGNVNNDQALDISDAVYSLSYLFAGGPAPAPQFVAEADCVTALKVDLGVCRSDLAARDAELAASSAALAESQAALAAREAEVVELKAALAMRGLPATGQTKCYGVAGSGIDCQSADFPGQDGFYQSGCPIDGRYKDNGDGTVSDLCTGLMWQKDSADVNGDGTIDGSDAINWQAALKYCDALDFAGHSDWRLPNVRELQSIVDYGRVDSPAIDPVFGAWTAEWWSSSTDVNDPQQAWLVAFNVGNAGIGSVEKGNSYYVRAVRGGR